MKTLALSLLVGCLASPCASAQTAPLENPCAPSAVVANPQPSAVAADGAPEQDRLLGVLPNYATVAPDQQPLPLCTKLLFYLAAKSAFDRNVYPYVAIRAMVAFAEGEPESWSQDFDGYGRRYAAIFADSAIGTYMTTAMVPLLTRQDPRFYVLGEGSRWRRASYAASRTIITRGRSGGAQFNVSEIGGAALAAAASAAYYPSESRSASSVLGRWATTLMWDTLSFELKEFWPDIRRTLLKR